MTSWGAVAQRLANRKEKKNSAEFNGKPSADESDPSFSAMSFSDFQLVAPREIFPPDVSDIYCLLYDEVSKRGFTEAQKRSVFAIAYTIYSLNKKQMICKAIGSIPDIDRLVQEYRRRLPASAHKSDTDVKFEIYRLYPDVRDAFRKYGAAEMISVLIKRASNTKIAELNEIFSFWAEIYLKEERSFKNWLKQALYHVLIFWASTGILFGMAKAFPHAREAIIYLLESAKDELKR